MLPQVDLSQHPREPSLLLLFRNVFGVSHTNANSKRPMFIVNKGVLKASFFGVGLERRREMVWFFSLLTFSVAFLL